MLPRTILLTVALMTAATPARAADLGLVGEPGMRQSGAVMGAYLKVPLGSPRHAAHSPRAGLRLTMVHDYRTASAHRTARFEGEGIELWLSDRHPTLYLAGRAMTGEKAKLEASGGGGGRLDKVLIGAAIGVAVAAGVVVALSVD